MPTFHDGSKLAEASLPYAEVLARASGATVTLVWVVADDDDPRVQDAQRGVRPVRV